MFKLKYLPHKKNDEKIVFFLRRHWFIVVEIILFYVFLACIPIFFYLMLSSEAEIWLNNELAKIFLVLLGFTYYLFWWMMFYYAWLDYFLDVWIVTNYRVINIEQRGMFFREIAENKLFRIQDVMSEQKGILPTLLNYGKINIQTAGTKERIIFRQVPRPNYVAQEMIRLIEWRKRIVEKEIDREEMDVEDKADLNNGRISGIMG